MRLFAGAGRLDPLLFMITTAGKDVSSLCYSNYALTLPEADIVAKTAAARG